MGAVGQPDVARRPGHCHRHAGGCSRGGGGEHRGTAGRTRHFAPAQPLPRNAGSGHAGECGCSGDHDRVPAAADPAGAGGQAVWPGRADHCVCAGRLAIAVVHRDPGAGIGGPANGSPCRTLAGAQARSGLCPAARCRAAPLPRGGGGLGPGTCRRAGAVSADRQIVHAVAGRRRHHHAGGKAPLHSPGAVGGHRSGTAAAHLGSGS